MPGSFPRHPLCRESGTQESWPHSRRKWVSLLSEEGSGQNTKIPGLGAGIEIGSNLLCDLG